MSLGRPEVENKQIRDVNGDLIAAHLAEYHKYSAVGHEKAANAVAAELSKLGYDIPSKKAVAKEKAAAAAPSDKATAASTEAPVEKAVAAE